jgi:hypothetical protein
MRHDTDPGLVILNLVWIAPPICALLLVARLIRWAWNR